MQNIPVFTTENGVASLTLKEIPYTKKAYIKIQDATNPETFVKECAKFCQSAGAEKIYACNHPVLSKYPEHTRILQMRCTREILPDTDAVLQPVQEQTLEQWRNHYNQAMLPVSNASYMTGADAKRYLQKGSGYFVCRGEALLGLGIASHNAIEAIVSLVPGSGQDVLLALKEALTEAEIVLEVASDNAPALRLYKSLGFFETGEISRWYQIL